MTSQKFSGAPTAPFEEAFEEAGERIRAINEKLIAAAKAAGSPWLDAYEEALTNLLEFAHSTASADQLDWISALARVQSDFVADVTNAYAKAARQLLK